MLVKEIKACIRLQAANVRGRGPGARHSPVSHTGVDLSGNLISEPLNDIVIAVFYDSKPILAEKWGWKHK